MSVFYIVYNLLLSMLQMVILPSLWWCKKRSIRDHDLFLQRMGVPPKTGLGPAAGRPRVWIHAVSVGEVKAAEAIVRALVGNPPVPRILLTTTTRTGQQYARLRFGERADVRYAPLDLWPAVRRFLTGYRPDLLVCMETEIWPNWLVIANRMGISSVFINGRISSRTIRHYMAIRPLIKPVLKAVSAFSMISAADAQRIIAMGAPADRVQVNGNAKMDGSLVGRGNGAVVRYRRLFAISDRMPVMIAGSVRRGELETMVNVCCRLLHTMPELLFIIAPRHLENTDRIKTLADAKGIGWQCRSMLSDDTQRRAPLLILDTIGELRQVYGVATLVFCGASLVPLGGQDILEPAAWARPVLYGPYMDDFAAARDLLESFGGGLCVRDENELVDRAAHLLTHLPEARRLGQNAFDALTSCQGAAQRHADVIRRLL